MHYPGHYILSCLFWWYLNIFGCALSSFIFIIGLTDRSRYNSNSALTIDINTQILPGKNLHGPNSLAYDSQMTPSQMAKRYHSVPSETGNHINKWTPLVQSCMPQVWEILVQWPEQAVPYAWGTTHCGPTQEWSRLWWWLQRYSMQVDRVAYPLGNRSNNLDRTGANPPSQSCVSGALCGAKMNK